MTFDSDEVLMVPTSVVVFRPDAPRYGSPGGTF